MQEPDFDRLATLMRHALEGDSRAYEAALREIAQVVRAYARVRLGGTLADDVVQETLLSVHRARHTYDPRRPIRPWLLAIAHSRVVDAARRQRRRTRNEEALDVDPAGSARGSGERSLSVTEALSRLPRRQRRVIELLKLEGQSAREVAVALGLTVSNVKVIAHRGYAALRRSLKDQT
ncbi:MAG TPA: sigma-70 family RNA polymerase sigma factor [Vicinamibacterales bacterium]|nr:sigma-70 family RNA polymerase sigma factor [Vicinamibacterales bacterium]